VTTVRESLAFDPGLPNLPVIDDHETIAELLAPGLGPVEVRRQDTKYEPRARCVAGYEFRHRATGSAPAFGALVVTSEGVESFPADRDPALPHLVQALDGGMIGARLAATGEIAVTGACVAVPVRYKPGIRCVIRYQIGDSKRSVVTYGKLLASGSASQLALTSALIRAVAEVEGAPLVTPVLAHWPDLGLLIQATVPDAAELHLSVSDLTTSQQERERALFRAGATLAALHSCELPEAPRRSLLDDLQELRQFEPVVAMADRALGDEYAKAVKVIEDNDAGRAEADVVSHGAFRTDQLLIAGDRLALIDLDTLCRSEPARDIGNLLAYLDWKTIRSAQFAESYGAGRDAFLDGYASRRGLPSRARISLLEAASLLKIAGRRFRSLTLREWPLVPALIGLGKELVMERRAPT
jgi:aminoglycoside phosphotransferase (APT) family kinase protein